jgi:hypothetical protein
VGGSAAARRRAAINTWGDKLTQVDEKLEDVRQLLDLFGKVSWYTSSSAEGGGEAVAKGSEPIASLRAVLKAAGLAKKEAMAVAWFNDQEIESIAD